MYLAKTPFWLKLLYPSLLWNKDHSHKVVYLSFDDGPTPDITDKVLDILAVYKAKASFFLIGKNVEENPKLFKRIKDEGHSIGNHTHNHLNGWKVANTAYLENIEKCQKLVNSKLFRPPYGRIKWSQARALKNSGYQIVMWDVLSADFDVSLDWETCYNNVVKHVKHGSIIVFHDSVKAWPRLEKMLPKVLECLSNSGYKFEAL